MSAPVKTRRHDLVIYYLRLRQAGLNDSHSGNASFRKDEHFWITPSGAGAETLAISDLVKCPLEGPIPAGASLDAPLHGAVYRALPEARAVLHSHGPYSIAMSLDSTGFALKDFEGALYFGAVPVLGIPYADYVERSPAAVADALRTSRVAIVRGHGIYAWGATLDLAYKWTCSLESSARIAWLARVAGITPTGKD